MTTEFFVLRRSVTTCSIMTWVDTHGGTMSHNVYVELNYYEERTEEGVPIPKAAQCNSGNNMSQSAGCYMRRMRETGMIPLLAACCY